MNTATLTDAQLVLASAADPKPFGEVFDRHAGTIYRFAWRRLGTELAKDVTAETFLVAFELCGLEVVEVAGIAQATDDRRDRASSTIPAPMREANASGIAGL